MVQKTVWGNDPNPISGQNSKLCTLDHQLGEYMNWTRRVGHFRKGLGEFTVQNVEIRFSNFENQSNIKYNRKQP